MEKIRDKMLGCLYGQAVGDALGLGTEFMDRDVVRRCYPEGLSRYEDIVQDAHRSRCPKGAWTDDTDMMLCVLNGYECGGFDIHKVARNFKAWADADPWDIGAHIYKILSMADYAVQPMTCSKLVWDLSHQASAANGALMRTSVVGLMRDNVEQQTADICRLTHFDPRCVGSCVIATSIIHALVWENRELSYEDVKSIGERYDNRIAEWIDLAYQSESISSLDLDESYSIGYTLRTLAAALWCYWHAESFEEGLLAVVNEGGDADTNAAVACAILGAKFGYDAIPNYYIDNLHNEPAYREKAGRFISLALI